MLLRKRKLYLSFSSPVLIYAFPPPSLDDDPFHLTSRAGSHLSFSVLVFWLVDEFDQLTKKSSKWWVVSKRGRISSNKLLGPYYLLKLQS